MIRVRNFASSCALAALILALFNGPAADAGEYVYGGVTRTPDRCARLGDGFVDVGNGVCGRVSNRIRVGGSQNAAMGGWTTDRSSNAAMRSTGPSMVPGGEITQRLRVRGNLDSFSPFR